MNKITMLLLSACIISIQAMESEHKVNLNNIPGELIINHILSPSPESQQILTLIDKFGPKSHLNDFESLRQLLHRSLIVLMCTSKTLNATLLPYINNETKNCQIFSCNNIYDYINHNPFSNIFLKQYIPIKLVENSIVALPLDTKIGDYTPVLHFSIKFYSVKNITNLFITFKFDVGSMSRNERQTFLNIATQFVLNEIKAYKMDADLISTSIIHTLLKEHKTLFENTAKNMWESTESNDIFSVYYVMPCNFTNDQPVIPLSSLNFKQSKFISTINADKTYHDMNKD
ncbi:MAG TPA: hypothetical protein VL201_04230 [Patescibacteria group bacterium]|jgi:hypothetical protein|nr:hypothetical protein [Patescibacteria group bacterium]